MAVQGKLIVVSAPSGSGKTTLVKHLLATIPGLAFSVSATSRAMREGEVNGKDYYFLTQEQFRSAVERGEFLEWEEVYPGLCYGTLKSEVQRLTSLGLHVVFDVDVVGGLNIKRQYGPQALSVFVMAPSVEELEKRLRARSSDSEQSLLQRISKAAHEMTFAAQFDTIIVNDDLESAKSNIAGVVAKFIAS
ncbi:MAG TPA: guanylate kinase [Bacteroidales bacterium]|nr:guanylate kinase [Bacteroidales bacterium]